MEGGPRHLTCIDWAGLLLLGESRAHVIAAAAAAAPLPSVEQKLGRHFVQLLIHFSSLVFLLLAAGAAEHARLVN